MRSGQPLTADQVLSEVLTLLRAKWKNEEMNFEPPIRVEVADDSDYHRTAKGYFRYNTLYVVTLPHSRWIIGKGTNGGGYPSDGLVSDILARKIPSTSPTDHKTIARLVIQSEYFSHSVVVVRRGGEFSVAGSEARQAEYHRLFRAEAKEVVAEEGKVNTEVMTMSLQPVYDRDTLWNLRMAELMAEAVAQILLMEDANST